LNEIPPKVDYQMLKALWRIENECFGTHCHKFDYFAAFLEEALTLVAYDGVGEGPVGFLTGKAFFTEDHQVWFYVNYLEVLPKCQKTGIGRYLLAETESFLRKAGITEVFLHCAEDVAEFYEKCGFRRVFKVFGIADDHLYWKELEA
jgi:ribosomal protein S18 acetylase RimI-like enzyme